MATRDNPLTDEDFEKCRAVINSCKETAKFLTKCANCKLDVDRQVKNNSDQLEIAEAILKEFGPGY